MDPFTLLMAAQGIVAGIRQGCEFLNQGKAQINDLKKAVGDVQAFAKEAQGLWAMLKSLWASLTGAPQKDIRKSDKPAAQPAAKAVAAVKKQPAKELTYEEYQAKAIHDICEQLKAFFEIKRKLTEHCKQLEEQSKTTDDVEGAALDRIQIEMQIENMTVQIREAMIYTPKELGLQGIYSRFLKMYDQILEEREFDRELKRKQQRDETWQREHRREILIYKMVYLVAVGLGVLQMTGLYFTLCGNFGCGS